jgi:thioredoxin 1
MSETSDDELERIREQKRKELREKLEEGSDKASASADRNTFDAPVDIDSESHLDRLLDSESPVLVDCYADWCGPCQMMEPTIESLAAETPAVVAKVDVDAHPSLAGKLGAQGVPTLVLFVEGEPVERLVGAQDKATLDRLIRQHL